MSLWWLQPGWKSATCSCGSNIWDSGGDPDMGECFECASARLSQVHEEQREYDRQMAAEYEEHLREQERQDASATAQKG